MAQNEGQSSSAPVQNPLGDGRFVVAALAGVALLAAQGVEGATLRVPFDHATIASAASAAVQGDSILVWRSPNGGDYENELINLQQGVTLRGMEPFNRMNLWGCAINCLEAPLIGEDDTTRVENLPYRYLSLYGGHPSLLAEDERC